jgi:hypothetical protein
METRHQFQKYYSRRNFPLSVNLCGLPSSLLGFEEVCFEIYFNSPASTPALLLHALEQSREGGVADAASQKGA